MAHWIAIHKGEKGDLSAVTIDGSLQPVGSSGTRKILHAGTKERLGGKIHKLFLAKEPNQIKQSVTMLYLVSLPAWPKDCLPKNLGTYFHNHTLELSSDRTYLHLRHKICTWSLRSP